MEIKLGEEVRDKVTEFTGIAISRLEHIDGGVEIGVQAKTTDGNYPAAQYIAITQLERIGDGVNIESQPRLPLGFRMAVTR